MLISHVMVDFLWPRRAARSAICRATSCALVLRRGWSGFGSIPGLGAVLYMILSVVIAPHLRYKGVGTFGDQGPNHGHSRTRKAASWLGGGPVSGPFLRNRGQAFPARLGRRLR